MPDRLIKSSKVRIDDINVSYFIKEATNSERKTIIFLHGFPFNKNTWRPQLENLADDITGIAIDIRGHGWSTSGHGFFSIDVFANDLALFIDKLSLSKVTLCGVSMGGYIALRAYELFPKKIEGLILSDTQHKTDDNNGKQRRFDSIQAILKYGKRPFSIAFLDKVFSKSTIETREDLSELIKSCMRRNGTRSICATQLALASRTDSTEAVTHIKIPTLLIRGAEDQITSKAIMEELHQLIPSSIFVEIPGSGHLPNLENQEEFNRLMNDFLNK